MLKVSFVRAIAERLVLGKSAAANRHHFTALQVVLISLRIYYDKLAFNFKGAIVVHGQFCFHAVFQKIGVKGNVQARHTRSLLPEKVTAVLPRFKDSVFAERIAFWPEGFYLPHVPFSMAIDRRGKNEGRKYRCRLKIVAGGLLPVRFFQCFNSEGEEGVRICTLFAKAN